MCLRGLSYVITWCQVVRTLLNTPLAMAFHLFLAPEWDFSLYLATDVVAEKNRERIWGLEGPGRAFVILDTVRKPK